MAFFKSLAQWHYRDVLSRYHRLLLLISLVLFSSCSVSKKIAGIAAQTIIPDSALKSGHIGISIYEPSTGKYLYNVNADKYFIPASTVKLFTLYAGLKYLGDSIPSMQVQETIDTILLSPTGDPTFLHPDFKQQPVFEALSKTTKTIAGIDNGLFKTTAYGNGWSWDDYNESFMNERSAFPVFGNSLCISGSAGNLYYFPKTDLQLEIPVTAKRNLYLVKALRDKHSNVFHLQFDSEKETRVVVPFMTSLPLAFKMLADTLHKSEISIVRRTPEQTLTSLTVYSRHVDSLYKPMIENSDNFFAEQTLLMSSNAFLGYMNEADMIDTLLKSELKDIPQKPRWVDGSGLSRYNLFTPSSCIYIMQKLMAETGVERLKKIFPTGGEGTLKNYFKEQVGYIFAKTGSLSNNSSLTGFMFTKKGKLLLFAIMVNNYPSSTTHARRTMEKFLQRTWNEY